LRLFRRAASPFFPSQNGTGGTKVSLSLAILVPPYGAVYATPGKPIFLRDECGAAPEFYNGRAHELCPPNGCRTESSRAHALETAIPMRGRASVQCYQPAAVALTQSYEPGTVYRVARHENRESD